MPTLNVVGLRTESVRLHTKCCSENEAERDRGYTELYDHLMRGARKLASHNRGPRGYLAEECCSRAAARIVEHISQLRDPQCFLAWCMQILRHEYLSVVDSEVKKAWRSIEIDATTRPQSTQSRPDREDGENPLGEKISGPDPLANVEQMTLDRETIRWLLDRIRSSPYISQDAKDVLIQGYLGDLDDDELADLLHTTTKNITVIRTRGRARLRRYEPELISQFERIAEMM